MGENLDDARLADVIAAAQQILRAVHANPVHVRPWLRGVESETERVLIDLDAARRRANKRFLSWLCFGLDDAVTTDCREGSL